MRDTLLQRVGLFFFIAGVASLLASALIIPPLIQFLEVNVSPDGDISASGEGQLRGLYYLGMVALAGLGAALWAAGHPRLGSKMRYAFLSDSLFGNPVGQRSPAAVLVITTLIAAALITSFFLLDHQSELFARVFLEDGIMETLSAALYLVAALFCVLAAFRMRGSGQPAGRLPFIIYLVLAAGLFFIGMEEISWGQRIIGWETPPVFAEGNVQNETNLHNFFNDYFPMIYRLIALIVVPILLNIWLLNDKRWNELASLLLPHPSLIGIGYLIAVVVLVWNHQEMIEELLSVFALFYSGRLYLALREPDREIQTSSSSSKVRL